jgi:Uma2 family endonuclease
MTRLSEAGASPAKPPKIPKPPPLEAGDHLDQETFHERYEAMPDGFRAELIGGIVFVPSPLKRPHSRTTITLLRWLSNYEAATPGTESHDSATAILGPESEPQPDAALLVTAPARGQTTEANDYVVGAPELVAEVASSTESIDLHRKRADYEQAGVREYLVVALRQRRVFWWVARERTFVDLAPGPDGFYRSEVFPGLWLDPEALLRNDRRQVEAVLEQGLASPEHVAFRAKLGGG